MEARARFVSVLLAVLVLASVLVSAGGASSTASVRPTLYFVYTMNCTFQLVDDGGRPITSIVPGTYQVDVRTPLQFGTVPVLGLPASDMTACHGFPQFQLTGPGVSFQTTMTAGCEAEITIPETFQPNATYVAVDNNQPSVARATFTTQSSGTPQAATATYGGGQGKGVLGQDLVGSAIKSVKGTLVGSVDAQGKLKLLNNGISVHSLTAGRYKLTITDKDAKGSFNILGPTSTSTTNLTGVRFVGQHSVTVNLKPGRWWFFTGLRKINSFVVVAG